MNITATCPYCFKTIHYDTSTRRDPPHVDACRDRHLDFQNKITLTK